MLELIDAELALGRRPLSAPGDARQPAPPVGAWYDEAPARLRSDGLLPAQGPPASVITAEAPRTGAVHQTWAAVEVAGHGAARSTEWPSSARPPVIDAAAGRARARSPSPTGGPASAPAWSSASTRPRRCGPTRSPPQHRRLLRGPPLPPACTGCEASGTAACRELIRRAAFDLDERVDDGSAPSCCAASGARSSSTAATSIGRRRSLPAATHRSSPCTGFSHADSARIDHALGSTNEARAALEAEIDLAGTGPGASLWHLAEMWRELVDIYTEQGATEHARHARRRARSVGRPQRLAGVPSASDPRGSDRQVRSRRSPRIRRPGHGRGMGGRASPRCPARGRDRR